MPQRRRFFASRCGRGDGAPQLLELCLVDAAVAILVNDAQVGGNDVHRVQAIAAWSVRFAAVRVAPKLLPLVE